MILKTCGTTTLLMTLEPLLEYTMALGMKVEWVAYTRKDFQRPGVQKFPHRDPKEEVCERVSNNSPSHTPRGVGSAGYQLRCSALSGGVGTRARHVHAQLKLPEQHPCDVCKAGLPSR